MGVGMSLSSAQVGSDGVIDLLIALFVLGGLVTAVATPVAPVLYGSAQRHDPRFSLPSPLR